MAEPLLEIVNLVKHYPVRGSRDVVHAVNDVSFQVFPGETLGLIGESGSGKTTVGNCILKLIPVTEGRIYYRGIDITALSQKEFIEYRPQIQMVFQEPFESLNPRMPVAQILDEPLRLAGRAPLERQERVLELMGMVRLDEALLRRYPHQLTGGQQQRVGIARAIATEPELVVLDEPTSELDISVRAEIIWLLKDLQERLGLSYIFISHDLTAVREISHRVAIMYLGQVVEVGTNEQIFASQLHPYAEALLCSVLYPDPSLEFAQVKLKGEIPSPVNLPSGCFLHTRCPYAIEGCSTKPQRLETYMDSRQAACWRIEEFLNDPSLRINVVSPA